jgi:hypothetical protein
MSRKGNIKGNNFTISDFYCTHCGTHIPLPRKVQKQREAGHLKHIYCPTCREDRQFIEIRPFGSYTLDDFIIELENGNFDEDGNRIEPNYKIFINNIIAKAESEDE